VIVTVLSFFVAIKPLSDGYLDAVSLVKFVIYTVPTVLAFALPFAGAFAATLVFLRLAADNEITACAASGISYFRVLLPVIGLGIVLMAVLLYMSNFVIPGYYKKATKTAQADALTMIESRLNQGLPVTFGEYVLYAESAQTVSADQIDDVDPLFTTFLQAGAARVLVPVRPPFNDAVLSYLSHPQPPSDPWVGADAPIVGTNDPLYVSLAEELRAATGGRVDSTPVGDPWTYKIPTSLVYLQDDAVLPDFTNGGN